MFGTSGEVCGVYIPVSKDLHHLYANVGVTLQSRLDMDVSCLRVGAVGAYGSLTLQKLT